MATRGFEFAYMIDRSGATPAIRDWEMAADASGYKKGDLLVVNSNGRMAKGTASVKEVSAICQETETSAVSNDDLLEVALVTPSQVWRCSMDATTTSAKKGYSKLIDVADENTIDADDLTNGRMRLVDTDTDDEGNVLAYVIFGVCTFGSAGTAVL